MDTAAFLARRHPNVHLDLSGIPPKKLLEYLPRLEDLADHCLWGTDYPSPGVASMKKNVEDFLALPLSEAAKQRILWDNAAALSAGYAAPYNRRHGGRILVVGAGTMGRGIAGLCALSGYDTWVFDADPAAQRAVRAGDRGAPGAARSTRASSRPRPPRRRGTGCDGRAAARRAPTSTSRSRPCPEALDLKRMVFSELDDLCPERTIFASNTSSLPIGKIAHATGRRDRVIGIHFFNPVAVMPLVEIVRGAETSPATEERALELVRSLGKEAVRVFDSPGFATSRLGVALGLEAMRMLEEGVAAATDIDRAMELGYGHRMGPLKTSDLVGLDVRLAIAETLEAELPSERFAPPGDPEDARRRGPDRARRRAKASSAGRGTRRSGEGARAAALARKR